MRKIIAFLVTLCIISAGNAATIINDTETERLLNELVMPLAKAADISPDRLKIHIIHSDEFNAFVSGGEDVYVYTGLLTQIKSPGALQAVVAHELGHTIGGHVAQMSDRMAAEMRRAMIIQALGVGLMVAGGNPSMGMGVLAGAGGVATSGLMAFSRDEERMADNLGLNLMIRAGQNPNGFIEVFEQMRNITGAAENTINPNRINHPLTTERLKNVREYIAAHPGKYKQNNFGSRYNLVRAKLIGYLAPAGRVRDLYPDSDKSDAALYARAISDMRSGNLGVARDGVARLISKNNKNPYFYELMGDIEYQSGNYDSSVAAYENALRYAGDAPQIQTALALVLTERRGANDTGRAIELCLRANLVQETPLAYWTLARAYDDGRADWARAEYYEMMGDTKTAKKYARRAQKKLSKNTPEYIKSGDILNKRDK